MKTSFINQLSVELQNKIEVLVKNYFIELGLEGEGLNEAIELALSGRLSDIEEIIDIEVLVDDLNNPIEKKIKIEDLPHEALVKGFLIRPVGVSMKYAKQRHKDGSVTIIEYQKIDEEHVKVLRKYNFS